MDYAIELLILSGLLVLSVGAGLAAGLDVAADEGRAAEPEAGPSIATADAAADPFSTRLVRTVLLLDAAALALIAIGAAMVDAAWEGGPPVWTGVATMFAFEAAVDIALAVVVARRPATAPQAWVLRVVAVYWLGIGLLAALTTGWGSFYLNTPAGQAVRQLLGVDPYQWVGAAVLLGPVLLLLAGLGVFNRHGSRVASSEAPRPRGSVRMAAARIGVAALLVVSIVPVWATFATAAAIAMGGCAPSWLVPSDPVFCVTAYAGYRTVTVSGQTSLPDGSLVSIWVEDGQSSEMATVHDGTFSFASSVSGSTSADTLVTVEFAITNLLQTDQGSIAGPRQPQAVTDRYGSNGARLSGPTAIWTTEREWHLGDDGDAEPIHVLDVRFECPRLNRGSHDTGCRMGEPPPQTEFGARQVGPRGMR